MLVLQSECFVLAFFRWVSDAMFDFKVTGMDSGMSGLCW